MPREAVMIQHHGASCLSQGTWEESYFRSVWKKIIFTFIVHLHMKTEAPSGSQVFVL